MVTGEAARQRFRAPPDQVDAAHAEMRALSSDGVGTAFRVEMAERWETQERTNRALMYRMFGEIADPPDETAMAPIVVNSLAARLRIPPSEVKRRMRVAERIQPRSRRRLHPPELPRTRLPLRGRPQPGLDTRRRHRRRLPVLRLWPRPQTRHRRPLPHQRHRRRTPGLDRRHHTTRHQLRPPPGRTPPRQHRPTPQRRGLRLTSATARPTGTTEIRAIRPDSRVHSRVRSHARGRRRASRPAEPPHFPNSSAPDWR